MTAHELLPPPPLPTPGERWALFLDVDGTLLDFALRPDLVRVEWPLNGHLRELHRALHGALALVSGREVADLQRLFAPLQISLVGLHGLEQSLVGSSYQRLWHQRSEQIARLRADADAIAARLPGVHVEHKGPCVALHCREAPSRMAEMSAAAQMLAEQLPGYTTLRGYEVCEIKPAQADKGMAVAALLEREPFAACRPVYLGDDHTDEPALRVVRERGGLAVAVGGRVSGAATHVLPYPHAVRQWLAQLAQDLHAQGEH
ncbi:MAG: trehalose-phosphatase [Metallibacterium scheffleri]|uniref:trehalose-phosphatase n=1 Tax=Metallibacterium scheffleri TaxID=993689 RepID=UPI0026ECFBD9|nr:trehalose-phosphatase [Metallibacterium scheffleri]MCK9367670.1 trehalose-phosphatase [Metallibacterium scheffleri]